MGINNPFAGVLNALLDLSGAQAGQIKFPATQNPSSDPNTIDDYIERKVWTPILWDSNGSQAAPGATYGQQLGIYLKCGRLVVIIGRVALTAKGTGGTGNSVGIAGLPVPADSNVIGLTIAGGAQMGYYDNLATNWTEIHSLVSASASVMNLWGSKNSSSTSQLVFGDLTNTSSFSFFGFYFANT